LHRRLGVVATTRASFGVYTEPADIEALADAIVFARRYMGA
jgi:selenocysteine lyase/cysteine desulfurase